MSEPSWAQGASALDDVLASARQLPADDDTSELCAELERALAARVRTPGSLASAASVAWRLINDGRAGLDLAAAMGRAQSAAATSVDRYAAFANGERPTAVSLLEAAQGAPTLRVVARAAWGDERPAQTTVIEPPPEGPPDLPKPRELGVRLEQVLEPVSAPVLYEDVVVSSVASLSATALARAELPLGERVEAEARMLRLVDAMACAGSHVVDWIYDVGVEAMASPSPWLAWAAVFSASCFAGNDAMRAVAELAERIPEDDAAKVLAVSDALACSPHPRIAELADALRRAPQPTARAVGVRLAGARVGPRSDELASLLHDLNEPVVCAALDVVRSSSDEQARPLLNVLLERLDDPRPAVAFAASRALLAHGRSDPIDALMVRSPLARRLGAAALELLALGAAPLDRAFVERITASLPATPNLLRAVGRLGLVDTAPFLQHFLADDELRDAAVAALTRTFGYPELEDPEDVEGWRAAIASGSFDPRLRYRFGAPWAPATIVEWCRSGGLGLVTVEEELEELTARTGRPFVLNRAWFGAMFDSQWAVVDATVRAVRSLRPAGTFWRAVGR
jgi:hypothetical protein